MWPFKKKAERKEEEKKKAVTGMSEVFRILGGMERSGFLYIDMKSARVFISSTLAACYIGNDAKWTGFLTNIHTWFQYRISQELWERYFKDVEAKAIRKAKKKYEMLTAAQVREIRNRARIEVDVTSVPAPEIKPYEFVITSDVVFSDKSDVVVVGYFDKGEFRMVPYGEVSEKVS